MSLCAIFEMRSLFPCLLLFIFLFFTGESAGKENVRIFEPTHFQGVRLPELSPENWKEFQKLSAEEGGETKVTKLRYFLLLHENEFLPEQNSVPNSERSLTRNPARNSGRVFLQESVPAACARVSAEFSAEELAAWRGITDPCVENALLKVRNTNFPLPSPAFFARLDAQNPNSSYAQELLELQAQTAWNSGRIFLARELWEREMRTFSEAVPAVNSAPVSDAHSEIIPGKTLLLKRLPTQEEVRFRAESAKKACESRNPSAISETPDAPLFPFSSQTAGLEGWRVTMTQVLNPQGVAVFDDFLPEEQRGTMFSDRRRDSDAENQECPQFRAYSQEEGILAARLGTHVTFWPSEERATRPQAYLAAFDLRQDGMLLWTAVPENTERQFVGNPLADRTCVYIPTIISLDGKRVEVSLDVYALSDGTFLRREVLFTAEHPLNTETLFVPVVFTREGRIQLPESGIVISL